MAHARSHEGQSTYYLEQTCTIAACGTMAGVCIWLYVQGGLWNILKPDQHLAVLVGGIGLLLLALIRVSAAWNTVGRSAVNCRNRIPADSHDHFHHRHHDHAYRDHAIYRPTRPAHLGWPGVRDVSNPRSRNHDIAPWRYALMILPVVLFLLGLPQAGGMNAGNFEGPDGNFTIDDTAANGEGVLISFGQLVRATNDREMRDKLEGATVRVIGQYQGDHSDYFTLVRYKINGGRTDAIYLQALIGVDTQSGKCPINPETYRNHWVQITGKLSFNLNDANYPVIRLSPKVADDQDVVKFVPPDSNP
jgi:hypothetical protein